MCKDLTDYQLNEMNNLIINYFYRVYNLAKKDEKNRLASDFEVNFKYFSHDLLKTILNIVSENVSSK